MRERRGRSMRGGVGGRGKRRVRERRMKTGGKRRGKRGGEC